MNNSSSSLSNVANGGSSTSSTTGDTMNRSNSVAFTGDLSQQAISTTVQREIFKQLELLLLKKKVGNGKITIKPGLLVTIPQVEKVSSLSNFNVNHNIENISNILVHLSRSSLHQVIESLIKMSDAYVEEHEQLQSNKNTRAELPSFKDETVESDCENSQLANLSSTALTPLMSPQQQQQQQQQQSGNSLQSPNVTSPQLVSDGSTSSLVSSPVMLSSLPPLVNTSSSSLTFKPSSFKQVSEDTPLYHLLSTIYLVLSSHQIDKNSTVDDKSTQLATLPPKVVTFLFSLLQYNYSPAIRYKAASCLQVISLVSLEAIAQIYVTKLQSGKSDDFYREYSTIQKSAKYLEFGFQRTSQIEGTSQYFAKILIEMEKVSRAVFIQSMCYTIVKAFPKMFNSNTILSNVPEHFWTIIQKMYDIIMKWTKKSKLKFVCIKALFSMIGCNQEFFTSKGTELLQLLSSTFKETSNRQVRKAYLECLVQYFNTIKTLYQQEAKAPFYQQQLDTIIPVILPKKSTPSPVEQPIILEILLAMGRFSLSIVVNKYLLGILTVGTGVASTSGSTLNISSGGSSSKWTNDFTLESRAIVFKLIYRMNLEAPEAIRYYDRTLWAVLDVMFSIYEGESTPMKHLLLLFPTLCSHENLKEIADKITKWTWHQELDIATMSTLGITKYLSNQPHTTFPGILLQMLTFITNYIGELGGLCKVIKNMSMIMQEFINLHYHSNKERSMSAAQGIEQTTWKNLRDTCEGISIYLLSSTMTPIWSEVYAFIQLTGHEIFREIDQSLNTPYLADYLPFSDSDHSLPPQQQTVATLVPSLNPELSTFLQLHSTVFPNAISWTWARLRKRWHPKVQAIGWKNNLSFLLLSLRLDQEHPELTSVEEQFLNEILTQYFQETEGKTNEEIAQFIYEISIFLHPSCYNCIFKFMEMERSRDLKRKKKETFYTQDHVIIYASQLIDRLSVSDYDNIPAIRSALREMTYFWITNPQIFKDQSLNGKNHISRILKNFLILDSQSTVPKGEISLNKPSYTKLIFQCLQSLSEIVLLRDDVVVELEVNTQKSILTLIQEGDLTDFKKDIIPWLTKCFGIGPHVYLLISENLAIFLRRSPKYLNEYIEKSFDNEKNPIGSLLFLRALVINFSVEWYSTWSHNCPPERLTHLSLFHMSSYDEEARSLAIRMANDLQMRDSTTDQVSLLQPHFYVCSSKQLPLHIYLRSALLYSNSMSSKYPWITPGLIDEANQFFKHLPFVHKQSMLSLLAPWTRNFSWVLNVGERLTDKHVDTMLESLFSLTTQARLSSFSNLTALEVLWGELISSGDTQGGEAITLIVSKLVDFLRDKFSVLQPLSAEQEKELNYTNQDVKDTSRMIMSFISRRSSTHWAYVVNHMIESLRYYKILPPAPLQYIQEYMANNQPLPPLPSQTDGSEESTTVGKVSSSISGSSTPEYNQVNEESILSFFEDLSFEFRYQDVVQVSNLIPMLLCNILYAYGPHTNAVSTLRLNSSKKILNNILLSLVIQQSNIDQQTKTDANKLIDSADWSRWKDKQFQSFIKVIQTSLGNQTLDIWETYSLQFAVQCKDVSLSLIALTWYSNIRQILNSKKEGMEGLLGLSCGLWKSTLCGELDRSFKFLHVFIEIIEDQQQNHKTTLLSETSYAIIMRMGSILLHTSYLQQFNGILILLYKSIQSLQGNPLQVKMIEEMTDILSAGMTSEHVVTRGISHPQTSLLSLWFAKEVSNFWEKKKNYQSSSLTSSLILNASMLVTMLPEESYTKEFIEYLFEAPVSQQLSAMLPLLYASYHYNVAKTPGSSPPPPPSDLARNLCREIFTRFPTVNTLISELFKCVTDMIRSLIDVGKDEACSFLLCFVNEVILGIGNSQLSNHPSVENISSTILLEFVYLVIDLCQLSTSKATREESQKTIPFILNNIPTGLALGSFDFIKSYNNSTGMANTNTNQVSKINCLFGFQTDMDIINNAYMSLYLINTYLYALPSDSPLNPQMKSILDLQVREKLKSSTKGTQLGSISALNSSTTNQFTSFVFSFKKKADIPKPSEILHSSYNNIQPPIPSPQLKQKPAIPTTPPPVLKGSGGSIPPPSLPPKRTKPKSEIFSNNNDLPPPN
ncbi:hypothetical protein DLAC_08226 [Tieghemostelium lacteum]|uniref:Uncharacterized protein n=1 Tax=Tieghemostelium lacteum TaxID=361077 RepID=A0A151ZBG3_TIELA|nr:hypothetical protein DLAC_08226 [Tieghemostelium lacteum]|eukprot:KYQ91286.1 hypothetical protein DLAC_08226 [Tieghemostelium lacteum]